VTIIKDIIINKISYRQHCQEILGNSY